jgi:hypothetical protein
LRLPASFGAETVAYAKKRIELTVAGTVPDYSPDSLFIRQWADTLKIIYNVNNLLIPCQLLLFHNFAKLSTIAIAKIITEELKLFTFSRIFM